MQRVDELLIIARAQRGHDEALRLAAREQRRAVGPGQKARFAHDVADLVGLAAVDAGAGFHNVAAQDAGFELFQGRAEVGVGLLLFAQCLDDRGAGGGNGGGALLLVADRKRLAHVLVTGLDHGLVQVAVVGRLEIEGLFRAFLGQVDDQVDHRLDRFVRKGHGAQHFGFGQLVGFGFHHHDGVFGAGHNQVEALLGVEAQVLHVVDGGVQDVFAILKAHAAACDRPHERRARDGQRGAGGDHRDDVGVVDQIVGQHGAHHQHFVLEPVHEQRTDRAVDQTRGQRFFLGGAGLTLEETAGDLARGIVFFLVVHGQREEALPLFGCLGEGDVGHHAGFAERRDHRAVCLACNLACFQCELFVAPLHGFLNFVEHHVIHVRELSRAVPGLPLKWRPHCRRSLYLLPNAGTTALRLRWGAHTRFLLPGKAIISCAGLPAVYRFT